MNPITSSVLSVKEIRRYTHQIVHSPIGLNSQERLKQARVLVVGAGGKGAAILENLASLGIGCVGISDNAQVQEQDLSVQHLYGNLDLGKQKAIISREKLRELNPMIDYRLHNVFLTEANARGILQPYELIIDTTGKPETNRLLSAESGQGQQHYIYCNTFGSSAFVFVSPAGKGKTFTELETVLKANMPSGAAAGFACRISLNTLSAALVTNEVVHLLCGLESVAQNTLLKYDLSQGGLSHRAI